jgi:hypothetical protein
MTRIGIASGRAMAGPFSHPHNNTPERPVVATMTTPTLPSASSPPMPAWLAADLQDHLLTATNDLDRLERLLRDASDTLMLNFSTARGELLAHAGPEATPARANSAPSMHLALNSLGQAVVALQFQDMASQLIQHTCNRLRNCADQIAAEALADDEEGEGVVSAQPLRPNPVTQDEMDAGSVELF